MYSRMYTHVYILNNIRFIKNYVFIKNNIFWDITPCSRENVNGHFGEPYRYHLQRQRINYHAWRLSYLVNFRSEQAKGPNPWYLENSYIYIWVRALFSLSTHYLRSFIRVICVESTKMTCFMKTTMRPPERQVEGERHDVPLPFVY
jgi:hypothetical protein